MTFHGFTTSAGPSSNLFLRVLAPWFEYALWVSGDFRKGKRDMCRLRGIRERIQGPNVKDTPLSEGKINNNESRQVLRFCKLSIVAVVFTRKPCCVFRVRSFSTHKNKWSTIFSSRICLLFFFLVLTHMYEMLVEAVPHDISTRRRLAE